MPTVLKKAMLVLLGLALAGMLTEALVWIFFPQWGPRTAALSRFWQHDALLGWSHVAHAHGRFVAFGSPTLVSINSRGFRDIERSYDRDPSKYRTVILGDSMVWGYAVESAEMFTTLLEKRMAGLEAINLGVSGYGTD